MPTLVIGGREVEVGDGFLALPLEQQNATVDHIAKSMAPVWSGTILPASKDAQGNVSFDSDAGILGVAKRAFMAPGDALLGKIPTHLPNGQPNPELLQRAFDFASMASPISAASRAGIGWAGAPLANLGRETVAPPTAQALKDAGSAGFDDAIKAVGGDGLPIGIHAAPVADLFRGLHTDLEQRAIIAENVPKTFALLNRAIADASPAVAPGELAMSTIGNLKSVREGFGKVRHESPDASERMASGEIVNAIDKFLETLDPAALVAGAATPDGIAGVAKTLRDARGNYAAAQRSNDLTGELDRAVTGITEKAENRSQATNSGRNFDNALRQRVASMLEKPRDVMGFSNAEIAALNEVLQGGPVRNAARYTGNLLGGGGGLGQAVTGMGLAAGGGMALGPSGVALGLVPPVIGSAAKMLENALARRSMRQADDVVRQHSPMYRDMQAQAPVLPAMSARDMTVLRALLPGLLSPQPEPQRAFGGLI